MSSPAPLLYCHWKPGTFTTLPHRSSSAAIFCCISAAEDGLLSMPTRTRYSNTLWRNIQERKTALIPIYERVRQASAHAIAPCTSASSKPKLYNPLRPERMLLYQAISKHFETWHELASAGQFDRKGDHHTPRTFVLQAFCKYLECGIFAHGFARADRRCRSAITLLDGTFFWQRTCQAGSCCGLCSDSRAVPRCETCLTRLNFLFVSIRA